MSELIININPLDWQWTWKIALDIITLILGVYEIIIRLWPTVGDYTIIGNVIKVLKWISDALNNKKKGI